MSQEATLVKVELAELLSRYFAALDDKKLDVATMSGLFAPDARIVRPNNEAMVGPGALAESHTRSMSRFRATQHLMTGFIADLSEDLHAAGFRANLVAIHLWAEGHGEPNVPGDENRFVAGGPLTGRAAFGPEGWRITELALRPAWRRGVGFRQVLETR